MLSKEQAWSLTARYMTGIPCQRVPYFLPAFQLPRQETRRPQSFPQAKMGAGNTVFPLFPQTPCSCTTQKVHLLRTHFFEWINFTSTKASRYQADTQYTRWKAPDHPLSYSAESHYCTVGLLDSKVHSNFMLSVCTWWNQQPFHLIPNFSHCF